MKKFLMSMAAALIALSLQAKIKPATQDQVVRVEPPCWWTGMKTELQLMIQGPGISGCEVSFAQKGLEVLEVHKADNPDFIFVDVEVGADAREGVYDIVFKKGKENFSYHYTM